MWFPVLFSGGDDRDRTDDLLNAIQALSQLSYAPVRTRNIITEIGCKINTVFIVRHVFLLYTDTVIYWENLEGG